MLSHSCAHMSPSKSTGMGPLVGDRNSTRLNSSHLGISYAVFCLKKNAGAGGRSGARVGAADGGGGPRVAPGGTGVPRIAGRAIAVTVASGRTEVPGFFFELIRRPPKSPLSPYTTVSP